MLIFYSNSCFIHFYVQSITSCHAVHKLLTVLLKHPCIQ